MKNNDALFFSRTYDFLHVCLPKEKMGPAAQSLLISRD